MKVSQIVKTAIILFILFICNHLIAQAGGWNPERVQDSKESLEEMIADNSNLQSFRDAAYAYVVFPKVTKSGFVFGGAFGKGVVFQKNEVIGYSKLKQATWGLQTGGQQYSEVIFFKDEAAFKKFRNGKLKFDAQASTVAIKSDTSIGGAYHKGIAIFTKTKDGLMYEASIGEQHFKYRPVCGCEEVNAALNVDDWFF